MPETANLTSNGLVTTAPSIGAVNDTDGSAAWAACAAAHRTDAANRVLMNRDGWNARAVRDIVDVIAVLLATFYVGGIPSPHGVAGIDRQTDRSIDQSFWITMLGNLLVMSLAFSATLTATLRAMFL